MKGFTGWEDIFLSVKFIGTMHGKVYHFYIFEVCINCLIFRYKDWPMYYAIPNTPIYIGNQYNKFWKNIIEVYSYTSFTSVFYSFLRNFGNKNHDFVGKLEDLLFSQCIVALDCDKMQFYPDFVTGSFELTASSSSSS